MNDMCATETASLMKKGWAVEVEITARPAKPGDPPDQLQWSMDSDVKVGHEKLEFDKNKQNGMKKQDYYLIEFKLKDHSGLNLRFAPNPSVAFWVNWNSQDCPEGACYCDEVYAVCVDQEDGDKMIVRNEDDTIADFAFSIGFLKGGSHPSDPNGYVRYDPIGSNKDGGL